MDNIFIEILDLFNPTLIYAQLDPAVKIYYRIIVPAVIILSIAARFLELQVQNLGQGAKWSEAIKDVKVAIIFTGLYAGFGAVVIKFHQFLCAAMYDHGSLKDLLSGYKVYIEAAKSAKTDSLLEKLAITIDSYSVETVLTRAIWFLSMLLLAFSTALLRIVYALGFCTLYLWGMVAVPTMSSKLLNVANGWFRGAMALFLWPLVESGIYFLLTPMFAGLAAKVLESPTISQASQKIVGIGLLYAFANILLMSVGVGAFVVAVFISMNQNVLSGLGSGIMGSVVAGSSMVMNAARLLRAGTGGFKRLAALGAGPGGANSADINLSPTGPSVSLDGLNSANYGSPGGNETNGASVSGTHPATETMGGATEAGLQGPSGPAGGAGGTVSNGIGNSATPQKGPGSALKKNSPASTSPSSIEKVGNQHTTSGIETIQKTGGAANSPGINDLKGK